MKLFNDIKKHDYIKNMETQMQTALSLLTTLNQLQNEYERMVKVHIETLAKKDKEIAVLKEELVKVKSR